METRISAALTRRPISSGQVLHSMAALNWLFVDYIGRGRNLESVRMFSLRRPFLSACNGASLLNVKRQRFCSSFPSLAAFVTRGESCPINASLYIQFFQSSFLKYKTANQMTLLSPATFNFFCIWLKIFHGGSPIPVLFTLTVKINPDVWVCQHSLNQSYDSD